MNRSELERTYVQHRQGLYALALSITRCAQGADDAVHEAFTRLCAKATNIESDPVAYVFASVRNAAVEQLRRRKFVESPASLFNGHAPDPRIEAERAERDASLRRAVDNLPDEQRETVVLKVYAGLTFEQIAAVSGTPLQTTAARYRRALEKLKSAFGEKP